MHGPFASLEALQAALDAWPGASSATPTSRTSRCRAFPASRFTPSVSALELRIPVQLMASTPQPQPAADQLPVDGPAVEVAAEPVTIAGDGRGALEVDRVVPLSGNLWIGGQQVWLGPAGCHLAGGMRPACMCCWTVPGQDPPIPAGCR